MYLHLKTIIEAITDAHHVKAAKMPVSESTKEPVPLMNCYVAPCEERCPIHQDIAPYMLLAGEGRFEEALDVIMDKNALPFITGTICAHTCMSKFVPAISTKLRYR